ncbi:MAG TPA: DUF416 family protein [Kofleriaceae bacterium]
MSTYDETALLRDLAPLSPDSRIAFAALCAERIFPAYELFAERSGRGDPDGLASALAAVWLHLEGTPVDHADSLLAHAQFVLDSDAAGASLPESGAAEAAASAIAHAVHSLFEGSPLDASAAARRAYDAHVEFVIVRVGVGSPRDAMAHPVVQAELARQARDLSDIASAQPGSSALWSRLRARTVAETTASVLWARL